MGVFGGYGHVSRVARLFGLCVVCLTLANCASSHLSSRVDPKYGTSASARVIEPGEPVPKGGGVYRVGKPYVVAGREYVPHEDTNYSAEGLASWYGDDFHGRYTANGEIFDMNSLSAAHPTLPLPSYVRVTNLANHKSIVVRVNDRGPYVGNRVIDVSVRTAKLLGFYGNGVTKVKVDYVGRAPITGSDDRKLEATLREGTPGKLPMVQVASAGDYAPTYFDSRPMVDARVPAPPDRPYRLGEGAREVPARAAPQPRIAAAHPQSAPPFVQEAAQEAAEEPGISPVSAYAPVRSNAPAGFMSGRGLY
ncbi:MAG TPA: septal ring lytic transglycosylase RlpA family protein [Pseudolabrys sp.]